MIYSVWNQSALVYDYYETPEPNGKVNAPMPKHLRPTKLGLTVRQAAWQLPPSAIFRGRGAEAVGRIASAGSSALGDISLGNAAVVVGISLVVMYLVMR